MPGATPSPDAPGSWIYPCNTTTPDLTYSFPGVDPVTVPGAMLNNVSAFVDTSGESECDLLALASVCMIRRKEKNKGRSENENAENKNSSSKC